MADDKTTPNAEGQVDGADDGTNDDGGKDDGTGDDGKIVFESQDELNTFVSRRLRRDRKSRKAVDKAVEADADDSDDDKGGQKSAGQQIHADATKLIEQAQRTAIEANALVAATEAGLPADRIRAAVKLAELNTDEMIGDDGEVDAKAVRSAIDDATKTYPFLKVAESAPAADGDDDDKPAGKVGGKTPKPDGDKAAEPVTKDRFAEMGYQERVQLFNRDPQLYERLAAAVA